MSTLAIDLDPLKERLLIPELWTLYNYPGSPSKSCRSPFRPDKSPSFGVYDAGRKWKDHATGEGGDAIAFIAAAEGIRAGAAVERFIAIAAGAGAAPGLRPSDAVVAERDRRQKQREATDKAYLRSKWPAFRIGDETARRQAAQSRGLREDAFDMAEILGTVRYATVKGFPCWVLTDASGLIAEARRLDRQAFPATDNLPVRKVHTLPGSLKNWPAGVEVFRTLTETHKVLFVEGGPDYLAALHFAAHAVDARGGAEIGTPVEMLPVAMLGRQAGSAIHPGALALLAGKQVRIYPHEDPDGGGLARATVWAAQLQDAGCLVSLFSFAGLKQQDGQPVADLNDAVFIADADKPELEGLLP